MSLNGGEESSVGALASSSRNNWGNSNGYRAEGRRRRCQSTPFIYLKIFLVKLIMATIGMMNGAFFVGRQEILSWLNEFLQLHYVKIEDTANGAASCQIFDALHPGTVALNKVNFAADREFEFASNYSVLQDAFHKVGLEKVR